MPSGAELYSFMCVCLCVHICGVCLCVFSLMQVECFSCCFFFHLLHPLADCHFSPSLVLYGPQPHSIKTWLLLDSCVVSSTQPPTHRHHQTTYAQAPLPSFLKSTTTTKKTSASSENDNKREEDNSWKIRKKGLCSYSSCVNPWGVFLCTSMPRPLFFGETMAPCTQPEAGAQYMERVTSCVWPHRLMTFKFLSKTVPVHYGYFFVYGWKRVSQSIMDWLAFYSYSSNIYPYV